MVNKGYLTAKTDKASDEYLTPAWAVEPVVKYLREAGAKKIWCPFDHSYSHYVRILRESGFEVICSHIDDGKNFFFWEPNEEYDVIVSNPPFSQKDNVLKRLSELGKPFMMLLPIPALQGQKRFPYLRDCQALIFDKRINFEPAQGEAKAQVAFGSFYLCKDILPKDLIFEELEI